MKNFLLLCCDLLFQGSILQPALDFFELPLEEIIARTFSTSPSVHFKPPRLSVCLRILDEIKT